jgi:translocation and assembly module TamB
MKVTAVNISKYFAYFFLNSVAIIVLVIMFVLSPLGVSTLVSFANKQDGITIENVSGSFYSEVKLTKLSVITPQINIQGKQVYVDIGLNCLFEGKACIEQFGARNIDITLIESDEDKAPSEPLTDYIELPFGALLEKFAIEKLTVYIKPSGEDKQKTAELSKISASVSMHKTLNLRAMTIADIQLFLPIDTQTSPKETMVADESMHWIKSLKEYEFQAIEIPEVFVPINANISKFSVGKFCIHQSQIVCTLQTQLNGGISRQILNASILTKPAQQIAASIDIQASVDFSSAYNHSASISVLPNAALTSQNAQALVLKTKGGIAKSELVIFAGTSANTIITILAKANVEQKNLPLDVEVRANNYKSVLSNWLPNVELPISGVAATIIGDIDRYEIASTLDVESEQTSKIRLKGDVSLTNKQIRLSELNTTGDIGKLNAEILARITQFEGQDGVSIESSVGFTNVQLKPLVPDVDSQLNGKISLQATMTPSQLWGSLKCNEVKGKLQGFDLSFLCDVQIDKKGLVKINSFALSQGKNKVVAKGQFELPKGLKTHELVKVPSDTAINEWVNYTNSAVDLTIDITDFSSIYANASGTIKGNASIIGKVDKPVVNAEFNIDKLVFNTFKLNSAKLNVGIDINKDWQTSIKLSASELLQESLLAQQIELTIIGDVVSHKLLIDLQHPEYSLKHEFSGGVLNKGDDWRWTGIWEKGVFASAFDSLTLEKPTAMRASQTSASVKPHCWVSSKFAASSKQVDAEKEALCIEKAQYSASLTEVKAKLVYDLHTPLIHYFPDIVKVGSSLPLTNNIELTYSPEKGAQLDSYSLMTQANINTSKHNIELVALVANMSLRDQVLKSNVFAGTKSTGAVGLRSILNLDPESRTHTGQFKVDNLILSPLQRFIPSVEKLSGAVLGNVSFDGLLLEPELNGELLINDVELVIDNYPYPITNFNQKITIANKVAEIEGELELGAGNADYSGTLTMFTDQQLFDFEGELIGAGMQLAFGKNEVLASPSLKIAVNPNRFSLKGEVTIPNAQIGIEELPKSAKSPSLDTIIIGKEAPPPIIPIGLDIDVRVRLDPRKLKRVTINALDLEASLEGDVRVQVVQKQNPQTLVFSPLETYVYGSINVLKGSYEAYGQNLQIRSGSIFFNGAPSLPQFDITAVRNPLNTADNVVAGLRISGNPVVPKVELFSQPSMIQARQLSYLILGTDIDGGKGNANDVMLVNALVNFGVGNSENGINKFGQSLGFDSLNLQTAGQGSNTQVQLTGRLSDNIQLTYGVGLFDQASEVILRYQLLPQLYLEATSGATSAVDLFYEWTRGE